jgi:alanine racemase
MGDVILVKGPRRWGIDKAAMHLVDAMAPNRFVVDLEVLRDNIRRFHRRLNQTTRILAMVKALAYGSDEARVAVDLEREGLVTHFGVATVDEGIALRAAGITRPIVVTMCTPGETRKAIQQNLTPVVYSKEIAVELENAAKELGKNVSVHIEVDTGMGRLGELPHEVPALADQIMKTAHLHLAGVMTHFASSDDPMADDFTRRQIELFEQALAGLREMGVTDILRHANATAATARFPESQYDMVRLGLGMFGVYPSPAVYAAVSDLQLAIALVSRIAEIRVLPAGHRIGYAGTYTVSRDNFRVGVLPIGYHDGIPWRLGKTGGGFVLVNGSPAPILGRISMDSMVIDLSDHPEAEVTMNVLIFGRYAGHELRPENVAEACDTIAYELLARIGPRVQRIFVGDAR